MTLPDIVLLCHFDLRVIQNDVAYAVLVEENLLFALDSATDSVAFFLINDLYRRIRDTYYISDRFYPFTPVSPFSEKGDGQDSFFK